ncbi:hypothetical protein GGF50DRAFT_92014 [Schizophyllum commune]
MVCGSSDKRHRSSEERGLRLNAESALVYASTLMPREEASLAGPAYVCARWRGLVKAGGVEGSRSADRVMGGGRESITGRTLVNYRWSRRKGSGDARGGQRGDDESTGAYVAFYARGKPQGPTASGAYEPRNYRVHAELKSLSPLAAPEARFMTTSFAPSAGILEVDYTFALACTRRALPIILTSCLIRISALVITSTKVCHAPPAASRGSRKKELLLRIEEASSGGSIRTAAEAF